MRGRDGFSSMTMMEKPRALRLAGRSLYSPELAARVCARVAAGAMITEVSAEDGMPERSTIFKWAKAHPEFQAALREAQAQAGMARRLRERAAREAARTASLANPRGNGGRRNLRYAPAIGEAICDRLATGETLIAICGEAGAPPLSTVYNWLRNIPEFEEIYADARRLQAEYMIDEAREVTAAATPKTVWADRLRFDFVRWAAPRLAPKKYCERIVAVKSIEDLREGGGGMTVIVKRYSDVTEEEKRRAEEGEP